MSEERRDLFLAKFFIDSWCEQSFKINEFDTEIGALTWLFVCSVSVDSVGLGVEILLERPDGTRLYAKRLRNGKWQPAWYRDVPPSLLPLAWPQPTAMGVDDDRR